MICNKCNECLDGLCDDGLCVECHAEAQGKDWLNEHIEFIGLNKEDTEKAKEIIKGKMTTDKPKTSAEIGRESRKLMFGDNDEAFPSNAEWSSIVD